MENSVKDTLKEAKDSFLRNRSILFRALQSSLDNSTFMKIVEGCLTHRFISHSEMNSLFLDSFTGISSAQRTDRLVLHLQMIVSILPDALDDILCILHESGSPPVQEAAKTIAKDYKFSLPKYSGLTSSQQEPLLPAVVHLETSPSTKISYQDHSEPSQSTVYPAETNRQITETVYLPNPSLVSSEKKDDPKPVNWRSRALMFIIGLVIGVVLVYFVVGFASKWMPKIVLRIFIFGLAFVALIAVAVGLIVAWKNGHDISKLQFLTLGILAPFLGPVSTEISKELSK